MDITDAFWGLCGAEEVLKLRSLRASGDINAYWAFHEDADYVRNTSTSTPDRRQSPSCR